MQELIIQIKNNLESNGFPQKKVGLPTEKMYEVADGKGLSLNKVLETMEKEYQIQYKIGVDRIVFSKATMDDTSFPNVAPESLGKVQEMLAKMDPAELQKIQEQVANMSENERKEMLEKAKSMGLF